MSDPSFYKKTGEEIAGTKSELDRLDRDLDHLFVRWEELGSIESIDS